MSKTANLYVRMEPDVKEKAEAILSELGMSASSAVLLFYKQIILQRGLPFDVKLPALPLAADEMTAEELDGELEKAYESYAAGKVRPAKEVFDSIRKDYGI